MAASPAGAINPRKLPRQRRATATVDAILQAAAQVIATGGLTRFNTNQVAARAGVSIGSLYQYFPGKDAIMAALIARQHARQAQALESALDRLEAGERLPLIDRVRVLVGAAMQHHHDDPLLASAIDHEEVRLPLRDVTERLLEAAGPRLLAQLEILRAEVPGIDPAAALRTLPALLRAVVDAWANLDPPDLARAEQEGVRAVMGYLTGASPGSRTAP